MTANNYKIHSLKQNVILSEYNLTASCLVNYFQIVGVKSWQKPLKGGSVDLDS